MEQESRGVEFNQGSECQQSKVVQLINAHTNNNNIISNITTTNSINHNINPNTKAKIPYRVRNRRYAKLLQLREQGFFDQQQIKLRHPLLYHLFVGQYQYQSQATYRVSNNHPVMNFDNSSKTNSNRQQMTMQNQEEQITTTTNIKQQYQQKRGLSLFLQSHLLNLQYKQLLNDQLTPQVQQLLLKDNAVNQKQITQFRRFNQNKNSELRKYHDQQMMLQKHNYPIRGQQYSLCQQPSMQVQKEISNGKFQAPIIQPQLGTSCQELLSSEQRQLQQQHLIQYCEELFLEGKLVNTDGVDYDEIDNNDNYDDFSEQERDNEQKYFDQIEDQMAITNNNIYDNGNEGGQYYTGIQDY